MFIKQADILGIKVAALTMEQAIKKVEEFIETFPRDRHPHLIATANAEMLMRSTKDELLHKILNEADLVVPDGAGTVWAGNYLGMTMPERVAGFDLVQNLLCLAPQRKWRIFFFGSALGVAEKAAQKACHDYPGVCIVGTRNGFFTEADNEQIVAEIKEARPDILLVALGVPKQEKWLYKFLPQLDCPVSIGVGGTFDVMAGVMKRAPMWMQRAKLEWLFRGMMQPKRAGRLMALPKFVFAVRAWRQKSRREK